ncbi:MAG: FxsA family protein [Thermoanaerobaculia bacterium]
MVWLFFLLIALPVAEIALLISIGHRLGVAATVALLLVSGLLGAFLARRQGLAVVRKVQSEMAAGRVPAGQLVDGLLILLAGVLLILPGVLTDALGFFCLLPAGRTLLKAWLRKRFEAGVRSGRIAVTVGSVGPDGMRNITPREPRLPSETKAIGSGDER